MEFERPNDSHTSNKRDEIAQPRSPRVRPGGNNPAFAAISRHPVGGEIIGEHVEKPSDDRPSRNVSGTGECKSRSAHLRSSLSPLYPQKQTSELSRGMSALCQKRTFFRCGKQRRYSITSSARASTWGGSLRPSAFAVLRDPPRLVLREQLGR